MEDIIDGWCEECGRLGPVDVTGKCTKCRSKEADQRRWNEAIEWKEDGRRGGLIYGASFPEPNNEDAPLCTRCKSLGNCGVITVDNEHLLSGCDLFVKRDTLSKEEKAEKKRRCLGEYEDDISNCIEQARERFGRR